MKKLNEAEGLNVGIIPINGGEGIRSLSQGAKQPNHERELAASG